MKKSLLIILSVFSLITLTSSYGSELTICNTTGKYTGDGLHIAISGSGSVRDFNPEKDDVPEHNECITKSFENTRYLGVFITDTTGKTGAVKHKVRAGPFTSDEQYDI